MSYKLALHVLAIFTEQVVAVHKRISLFWIQSMSGTSVRRGEATVPWPPPQTLKIKNVKTVLSKTCFQNAQKCIFFGEILQNFPGGHACRMDVSSALPLKLICDVTRLWQNLYPPRKFSAYATDVRNKNSHTETNEKVSGKVIWPHSYYIFIECPVQLHGLPSIKSGLWIKHLYFLRHLKACYCT